MPPLASAEGLRPQPPAGVSGLEEKKASSFLCVWPGYFPMRTSAPCSRRHSTNRGHHPAAAAGALTLHPALHTGPSLGVTPCQLTPACRPRATGLGLMRTTAPTESNPNCPPPKGKIFSRSQAVPHFLLSVGKIKPQFMPVQLSALRKTGHRNHSSLLPRPDSVLQVNEDFSQPPSHHISLREGHIVTARPRGRGATPRAPIQTLVTGHNTASGAAETGRGQRDDCHQPEEDSGEHLMHKMDTGGTECQQSGPTSSPSTWGGG